jgi:hypothetical protein
MEGEPMVAQLLPIPLDFGNKCIYKLFIIYLQNVNIFARGLWYNISTVKVRNAPRGRRARDGNVNGKKCINKMFTIKGLTNRLEYDIIIS